MPLSYAGHRLNCGKEFKGSPVESLTLEVCRQALETARPNKIDKAALEWRIAELQGQRPEKSVKPIPVAAGEIIAGMKIG